MKNRHIALGLLVALSSAMAHDKTPPAACTDCWDGTQGKHFVASGVVGIIVSDVFKERPRWQQFGTAMIPGVVKELGDGKISSKDMLANALGAGLGLYLGPVMFSHARGTTTVAVALQW